MKWLLCLMVFSCFSFSAEYRYFGVHLAASDPWVNQIRVMNTSPQSESFSFSMWDQSGALIVEEAFELEPGALGILEMGGGTAATMPSATISLPRTQGSFCITSSSPQIVPVMSYQFGDSPSISQFFLSTALSDQFLLPHVEIEAYSWAGLAFMNPADSLLTLEAQAVSNGTVVARKTVEIVPHGKYVAETSILWPDLDGFDFDQILISANASIPCPILLTGNKEQDRHLFFQGVPIDPATEFEAESYNLYAPLNSKQTYLMANDGQVVHTWKADYSPGNAVYMNEDGSIWHTGRVSNSVFQAGGAGGSIQKIGFDGSVEWDFIYSSDTFLQHHDMEPLPNGNILLIAWEWKSYGDVLNLGRDAASISAEGFWFDALLEIQPTGLHSGEVVWAWHLYDHLIQDRNPDLPNYGTISDFPGRVDINANPNRNPDWTHINSVDYHPELDQIVLSVHNLSEIWIIDHSTTLQESSGNSGGLRGHGGDLLYRWGNPQIYGRGTPGDQKFFSQHDAEWIPEGFPGAGNVLIFNNGVRRPGGNASSVDEIALPLNSDGLYELNSNQSFEPTNPVWSYQDPNPTAFYAQNISGAQRLKNGNTLICDGPQGRFFEVTPEKETVWQYDTGQQVFRVDRYELDLNAFPKTSF